MRPLQTLSLGSAALLLAAALPAAARSVPAEDKPVCRSEKNTGSRISTSECHTRAEWVEIDAVRVKQAEQFQRNMNNPAADRGVSASPIPR